MPKKRRTVDMTIAWEPPKPPRSPNVVAEGGIASCRKVADMTQNRARPNTESPWQHPWGPGVQQIQMVHPTRNAQGGPRGLSPTETPERMKGNEGD